MPVWDLMYSGIPVCSLEHESVTRLHTTTFVKIPKQEKLSSACRCTADMAEQIHTRIPKHAIKTQNNLLSKGGKHYWQLKYSYFRDLSLGLTDDRTSKKGMPFLFLQKILQVLIKMFCLFHRLDHKHSHDDHP